VIIRVFSLLHFFMPLYNLLQIRYAA